MLEIAGSRFIINSEAVLVLGPPGVRQDAHLAVAVGREAIVAGYTVLATAGDDVDGPALPRRMPMASASEKRLVHYAKPKPLIVDGIAGLLPGAGCRRLLFQLAGATMTSAGASAGDLEPGRSCAGYFAA